MITEEEENVIKKFCGCLACKHCTRKQYQYDDTIGSHNLYICTKKLEIIEWCIADKYTLTWKYYDSWNNWNLKTINKCWEWCKDKSIEKYDKEEYGPIMEKDKDFIEEWLFCERIE